MQIELCRGPEVSPGAVKRFLSAFNPLILMFIFFFAMSGTAAAVPAGKTYSIPVTIDYPLLSALVQAEAYVSSGNTAIAYESEDSCTVVVLSNPVFSRGARGAVQTENGKPGAARVVFSTDVAIRAGKKIFGVCIAETNWSGRMDFFETVTIDPIRLEVGFHTEDSALAGGGGGKDVVMSLVWRLVKTHVYAFIDSIKIGVAPPVESVKRFIGPLLTRVAEAEVRRIVDGFSPSDTRADDKALYIDLTFPVSAELVAPSAPVAGQMEQDPASEKPMTKQELESAMRVWEAWDGFLMSKIGRMGQYPLTDDEQADIMAMLISFRTEFVRRAERGDVTTDFIRAQFVQSWLELGEIFKNHLIESYSKPVSESGGATARQRETAAILGYLAFITASDAVTLLDHIGPKLGVEISRDGFERLARMMNDGEPVTLDYIPGKEDKLRAVLGLAPGPEGDFAPEGADDEGVDIGDEGTTSKIRAIAKTIFAAIMRTPLFTAEAHAAEKNDHPPKSIDVAEIKKWIITRENMSGRVEQVRSLLETTAEESAQKKPIPPPYREFFDTLSASATWQESCFRQFKMKGTKALYLRSYNGTSVGIMQINELVWRGIYDPMKLRWNTEYNVKAGIEILRIYLERYALRKLGDSVPENETLASIVYAMYNGGPSELKKYQKRAAQGKKYESDKLFREKYEWVVGKQWDKVGVCLFGGN